MPIVTTEAPGSQQVSIVRQKPEVIYAGLVLSLHHHPALFITSGINPKPEDGGLPYGVVFAVAGIWFGLTIPEAMRLADLIRSTTIPEGACEDCAEMVKDLPGAILACVAHIKGQVMN